VKNIGYLFVFLLFLGGLLYLLDSKYSHVLSQDGNVVGVVQAVAIIVLLSLGILHRKINIIRFIKEATIWLGILLVIISGYSYQYEISLFANRILGNIFPTLGRENPDGSVTFYADRLGHFMVSAKINGVTVNFLLDTGATNVVLSPADARRIGINTKTLRYQMPTSTANGISYAAAYNFKKIEVGSIRVYDVEGAISSGGLDTSLLGMSFLSKLRSFEVSQGSITLSN
jgi:aspartyl protease family protein